jgi:hypothetical protein
MLVFVAADRHDEHQPTYGVGLQRGPAAIWWRDRCLRGDVVTIARLAA